MWDLFHHPLQEEEWFAILALTVTAGVFGIVALRSILTHLHEGREAEQATALKMEMIQRGMSAADIERVLAAKFNPAPPSIAGQVGRAAGELVRQAVR
jgi:hypothetical protein